MLYSVFVRAVINKWVAQTEICHLTYLYLKARKKSQMKVSAELFCFFQDLFPWMVDGFLLAVFFHAWSSLCVCLCPSLL